MVKGVNTVGLRRNTILILLRAERIPKNVLLRFKAGRYRSQMILDSYTYMIPGEFPEDSTMIFKVKNSQLLGVHKLKAFLKIPYIWPSEYHSLRLD